MHSRECIVDHLAQPEPPESDGTPDPGAGGAPSPSASGATAGYDGTSYADGAGNTGGTGGTGAVDLELGAGDLTVLVIFDKSGSMGDRWDERNKWHVANDAFMKAIEGVLDNLTIGAIFFPDPGGCEVAPLDQGTQIQFATGRAFYDYWQASVESRTPDGGTPLERAFYVADSAIEQGCRLGLLRDRFRVLLVTDGEPTCSDDPSAIVNYAAEWHRLGVETWVMGIPGSAGAAALLDSIAAAGGTEKHQSLGDPSQLDDGLYTAVR